jgi:8-oxo-dGTP pyrophosphatase MutT (NUDIX family)
MIQPPDRWNVVFLLDALPPENLVVLQRAANKRFAPGLYTGIGGKVEPGEDILSSAYRELLEETGIHSGQVELHEFARADIDGRYVLHYFWGVYPHATLPQSADGHLRWVRFLDLLNLPLIPTTWEVCRAWRQRGFCLSPLFTVHLHETGQQQGVRMVEVRSC